MHNKNLGFTLIELMIVVAIIGILSSVALPAYQTYIAKSSLTSLYATAGAGRTAMLSRYQEIGEMPDDGSDVNGIAEDKTVTQGLDKALRESYYQSAVVYTKDSKTKATFAVTVNNINANVNNKVISFSYEDTGGSFTSTCSAPLIPAKYTPKACH